MTRSGSKSKIFDTGVGGFIYSDQFIQISTELTTNDIYGFGENVSKEHLDILKIKNLYNGLYLKWFRITRVFYMTLIIDHGACSLGITRQAGGYILIKLFI